MEKKKVYTLIIPICTLVVLITFCWWGYSRLSLQEKHADVDLYTLIPDNCEAILETNDINTLYKTIRNSNYMEQYNLLDVSELLTLLNNNLETLSQQQAHGISAEMNRQLLVSFHNPGTTHDQIIYGRFGSNDVKTITQLIKKGNKNNHSPKTLTYKGEKIIIYPLGKEFLACYLQPGFFAVSFQKNLIEKVIDAYIGKEENNTHPNISSLKQQTKHNELLSLYLPPHTNGEKWKHYEIRMNASAIYLTSNQETTDTINEHTEQTSLLERTDGSHLPQHIQMMIQLPFVKNTTSNDSLTVTPDSYTLKGILTENNCKELNFILFSQANETDTLTHQLLMAVIPIQYVDKLVSQLRYPNVQRRANLWQKGISYPIWQCKEDTTLNSYFISQADDRSGLWLSLYHNNLLVANNKEALYGYLAEMQETDASHTTNKTVYQHCLGDLAEEANFTLVTDLNDLINRHPNIAENNPLIPSFFFKHKDFFKHFMLATQHINNGKQMNIQLILTYQGDSLLFKRIEDVQ